MVQLNSYYDDYILQLDGAPPIFTGMYECFWIVYFNSTGRDVLQKSQPPSPMATPFAGSYTMWFLSLGVH
jgi:hypothetical protein